MCDAWPDQRPSERLSCCLGRTRRGKGFNWPTPRHARARRACRDGAWTLLGERAVDLHLGGALGQSFLLATLAIGGEVGRLAVHVEGRIVPVHLVEEEDVGILRGAMRAIDEAARLRFPHDPRLLGEQHRQRIALALRRPELRDYGEHVGHGSGSPFRWCYVDERAAWSAFYAITGHFGRAVRPARDRKSTRLNS